MSLINRDDAVLVIIDCQTKLMPAINNADELEKTICKMTKGASVLGLPVIVTQQYTKGLGPTVDSLNEILGDYEPVEKTTFSAMGAPEFAARIRECGKKNIIMTGVETHICVEQTTLELLGAGYNVYLIQDCVGSRKDNDKNIACNRMAAAGASITTYEAILYELMRDAKNENFKSISAIVK